MVMAPPKSFLNTRLGATLPFAGTIWLFMPYFLSNYILVPLSYYKPELSWQAIAKESPDSIE